MPAPFIIYGLPRSRTAWLSMFLTYGEWTCHHEKAMFMRKLSDVVELFSTPNTGSAETGASYGRCLLKFLVPDIKEVVILRSVDDVMNSLLKIQLEEFTWDEPKLRRIMERGRRSLERIAKDPNVMVVNYEDLDEEETCRKIFEFCLPYKFDRDWWAYMDQKVITLNFPFLMRYRKHHKNFIDNFKSTCKRELISLCRRGLIPFERIA